MASDPERTNYSQGLLLGLEDFEREQAYLIARLRRHNRYAHGWGVLHGLGVAVKGGVLQVEPGIAIDCEGNELELRGRFTADLSALRPPLSIGLAYVEVPVSPVPTIGGIRYAATRETAEAILTPADPGAGHDHAGPGTPGCGLRHPVILARLSRPRRNWRVHLAGRRSA